MSSPKEVRPIAALLGMLVLGIAAPAAQATTCDLTGGIASPSCTINGAIYENPDNSVIIGSGLVNPFLTVQQNGTESGFSTDALTPDLPLDVKRAEGNGQFTRTFSTSQLGIVTVGVTDYYQFFLDINEPASTSQSGLSLDLLKIYDTGSSSDFLVGSPTTLALLDATYGPALYDLGAGNNVLLDFNVFGKGSGQGIDLDVLIPTSLFAGVDPTHRLTFATKFGNADPSQDGFEEWWYLAGEGELPPSECPPGTVGTPPDCVIPPSAPEPGSLALMGLGMAALAAIRRRRPG